MKDHKLKHLSHPVEIRIRPATKSGASTFHAGELRCVLCQKHIQWLSIDQLQALNAITPSQAHQIQSQLAPIKAQVRQRKNNQGDKNRPAHDQRFKRETTLII